MMKPHSLGQGSKRKRTDTKSPPRRKRARTAEFIKIESSDEYDDQGLTDLDQDGVEYDSDDVDEIAASIAGS